MANGQHPAIRCIDSMCVVLLKRSSYLRPLYSWQIPVWNIRNYKQRDFSNFASVRSRCYPL